ncbi:PD-(D/E)XK nuclease family protein [uncultured Brachyspira sp.]|uniref:PD-(D/E)XK nuclease family protein n=1 Tax=uncultured Brachyspira sp. TaxID=221953 RepID=UPI002624E5FE|nr:PD-(D/E)XK nuclease family protein [uncultured Brachyspira sp.]
MNDEQLLNSFYNLICKKKDLIFDLITKENKKIIPQFNIIKILDYSNLEIYNSKLIYEMLKLNFIADNEKEVNFARDFANYIIKKEEEGSHTEINTDGKIDVYREVSTSRNRRIDILIKSENNFEIILENKINSYELNNQLYDYYKDRSSHIDEKKLFVVLLTKYGDKPTSLGDKYNKLSEDNRIRCLSHDELGDFIEKNIIGKEEYSFLWKDIKYHSLYSGLIQMRDNEKLITKQFRNEDMEDKVIKKFLIETDEYKSLNSVEDINNYADLLYRAANIIKMKKIEVSPIKENIDLLKKVIEELNKYFENKENSNNYILSIENIEYHLINDDFSRAITLNLKDSHLRLSVILWIAINQFYICVFSNDAEIKNKLYDASVRSDIYNIMKFEEENENNFLYTRYIYDNANVEDVVSIIIGLYEYLERKNL